MTHEYRRRTDANLPLWPMGLVFVLAAMIGLVYLTSVLNRPNAELPAQTVAPLAANMDTAEGRSMAINGTVREQWGLKAFLIRDHAGQEILVVDATTPLHDESISVSVPPPTAHVEGRVFRKDDVELRRHLPLGFDQRLIDDYTGRLVLVATAIRETEPAENDKAQAR